MTNLPPNPTLKSIKELSYEGHDLTKLLPWQIKYAGYEICQIVNEYWKIKKISMPIAQINNTDYSYTARDPEINARVVTEQEHKKK